MNAIKMLLVCLAVSMVQCQLTSAVKDQFKNLANAEIQKQLLNGSDAKNANLSQQTQKSFMKVAQAGSILKYLGFKSELNNDVCKWLASAKLEGDSVDTVFYRAEGMRLFECKDSALSSTVRDEIQKILTNPGSSLA